MQKNPLAIVGNDGAAVNAIIALVLRYPHFIDTIIKQKEGKSEE